MAAAVRNMGEIGKLGLPSYEVLDGRLLGFLAAYAAANGQGACPGLGTIATQLGVSEEEARRCIGRCENRDLIHVISRNPLRIMLLRDGKPLPHEPGAADLALAKSDPDRFNRFLDVEAQRHRLGRFVGTFERETGRGPSLRECMDFVGYQNASYVRQMLVNLSRLGLVQYGSGVPTKLTAEGRRYYGPKGAKEMEQKTKQGRAKPVIVCKDKKPKKQRVEEACRILGEFRAYAGEGERPRLSWIAARMGFSATSSTAVSDIFQEAARMGYVEPWEQVKGAKPRLQFTDKGRERFMPKTDFAEVDEAPPPEQGAAPEPTQEAPLAPLEWRPQPPVRQAEAPRPLAPAAGALAYVETSALVLELIERGYIVKKGG